MPPQDLLKIRQDCAQRAYDKMLTALIGYGPCGKLTIDDVTYIARVAQTLAFAAIEQAVERGA